MLVVSWAQSAPPASAETFGHAQALKALSPPAGAIWHGVFPGGRSGEEDDITLADVRAYERAVGHRVAWVYFSNNWYRSRAFPNQTANWIRKHGATPYIRLMMRSDPETDHAEPRFTLQRILRGDFDRDLKLWMRDAARFGTPLIVEFGTEMNGEWFSWNARWNGRQKGAVLFADTYRHIIDLSRAVGATNIVWVFHVNWADWPDKPWNRFEKYYPGDEYIDWLGVSIYSMQAPDETDRTPFSRVGNTIRRLSRMAPGKPVIIAEFATDVRNPREPAAVWADNALRLILSGKWPQLVGFSWWNETWQNDDDPANDSDMRVTSDPALAAVFRRRLSNSRVLP
ncbi:MAG TPA: beta-mannanase [Rhodobacteraceae bacterium]|nr:beta-mannanase [Paracoccaceae bacterium]